MRITAATGKLGIGIVLAVVGQFVAWYSFAIRSLPLPLQGLIAIGLAALPTLSKLLLDLAPLEKAASRLRGQVKQLRGTAARSRKNLSSIQRIMARFLDRSEIYQQRVIDQLRLREDYVCIMKYGEGLSEVWKRLEPKERLPFAVVLQRIPGSIQPFSTMGVFLLPTSSLPGLGSIPLRAYIQAHIIPNVERERGRFLRRHADLAHFAEEFSYRYLAFYLRKNAIAHAARNRSFGADFNAFIFGEQAPETLAEMQTQLENIVRTKDVLRLVNWSAFTDFNPEQQATIDRNQLRFYRRLDDEGLADLTSLCDTPARRLSEILWGVLPAAEQGKTTRIKILNIAKKVVNGVTETVRVMAENGVKL